MDSVRAESVGNRIMCVMENEPDSLVSEVPTPRRSNEGKTRRSKSETRTVTLSQVPGVFQTLFRFPLSQVVHARCKQ